MIQRKEYLMQSIKKYFLSFKTFSSVIIFTKLVNNLETMEKKEVPGHNIYGGRYVDWRYTEVNDEKVQKS